MRLFRNTVSVLATSLASMPLYFVTSIVLARFLTVEDRGLYGVSITTVGMAALISELGWGPATIYRIRRVGVAPGSVASAGIVAALMLGLIVVGVGLSLDDWIRARFLDNAPPWVLYMTLAAVPIQILWMLFASMARAIDRFGLQNAMQLLLHAGRLIGMSVALILLGGALREALTVYLAMLALVTAGVTGSVLRQTGLEPFRFREMTAAFSFGLRSYAARIAGHIHERVDIFMIAYLLGNTRQVAFYAIGAALMGQLKVVPESVARALFPQLAGTPEEHTGALAARVARHSFVWVLVTVVLAAPAAPFLIPVIYGSDYKASVLPFLVLLPGMALFTRYRVLSHYFVSLGLLRPVVMIQVTSVVLNVSLNWLLIPRQGILGAALASTISHATAAVWVNLVFCRHAGISNAATLLPRREDAEPYRRRLEMLRRRLRRLTPRR